MANITQHILKFFARKDYLVPEIPGRTIPVNQAPRYANRKRDKDTREWRAQKEPLEVVAESNVGREFIRRMRKSPNDPPMWAADIETAQACGVQFTETELVDGEHVPVNNQAKAPKPSARKAD